MSLSFSDRALIRLPAVMMNGQGEFISGGSVQQQHMSKRQRCLRLLPQTPHHHSWETTAWLGGLGCAPHSPLAHHEQPPAPSTEKPWSPSSPPLSTAALQQCGADPRQQGGLGLLQCLRACTCPETPTRD